MRDIILKMQVSFFAIWYIYYLRYCISSFVKICYFFFVLQHFIVVYPWLGKGDTGRIRGMKKYAMKETRIFKIMSHMV